MLNPCKVSRIGERAAEAAARFARLGVGSGLCKARRLFNRKLGWIGERAAGAVARGALLGVG